MNIVPARFGVYIGLNAALTPEDTGSPFWSGNVSLHSFREGLEVGDIPEWRCALPKLIEEAQQLVLALQNELAHREQHGR